MRDISKCEDLACKTIDKAAFFTGIRTNLLVEKRKREKLAEKIKIKLLNASGSRVAVTLVNKRYVSLFAKITSVFWDKDSKRIILVTDLPVIDGSGFFMIDVYPYDIAEYGLNPKNQPNPPSELHCPASVRFLH